MFSDPNEISLETINNKHIQNYKTLEKSTNTDIKISHRINYNDKINYNDV